jgi:tetratricopeptide (TPR) repeat protein
MAVLGVALSLRTSPAANGDATAGRAVIEVVDKEAAVETAFARAKTAYDEGRMADAINAYHEILDGGFYSTALFFNLGNAQFRRGQVGPAVLNFRRAMYLAPGDPDVRKNLAFALETTGAAIPVLPLPERLARGVALGKWVAVALAGYWGAALAGAAWILWPRRRGTLARVLAGCAVLVAVALTAVVYWAALLRSPEVVVTTANQEALFAPLQGATAHFAAPEGTILRAVDASEGWVKVAAGKKAGWIPRASCEQVYPFDR